MSQLTPHGSSMVVFRKDRRGLRASGEADLSDVDYFASVLGNEARRATNVVLDVTRLSFLSVDGCQSVRRIARGLDARGGSLQLVTTNPSMQRMFPLLGSDGNPGLRLVDARASARAPKGRTPEARPAEPIA